MNHQPAVCQGRPNSLRRTSLRSVRLYPVTSTSLSLNSAEWFCSREHQGHHGGRLCRCRPCKIFWAEHATHRLPLCKVADPLLAQGRQQHSGDHLAACMHAPHRLPSSSPDQATASWAPWLQLLETSTATPWEAADKPSLQLPLAPILSSVPRCLQLPPRASQGDPLLMEMKD